MTCFSVVSEMCTANGLKTVFASVSTGPANFAACSRDAVSSEFAHSHIRPVRYDRSGELIFRPQVLTARVRNLIPGNPGRQSCERAFFSLLRRLLPAAVTCSDVARSAGKFFPVQPARSASRRPAATPTRAVRAASGAARIRAVPVRSSVSAGRKSKFPA